MTLKPGNENYFSETANLKLISPEPVRLLYIKLSKNRIITANFTVSSNSFP